MAEKNTIEEVLQAIMELAQENKKTEAVIQEVAEAQKKTEAAQQKTETAYRELVAAQKKTEAAQRKTAEAQQKTEEVWQQTRKEIEKDNKRFNWEMKKLNDLFTTQWGRLIEVLVDGDLVKLLREKKIEVERTLQNIKRERDRERWEVDILAINGDEVVVVEVKTKLTVGDVDHFIDKRLKSFVRVCPEYKGKKIYGAVAYLKADQSSDIYAERQGLFAIRAVGSSAGIVNQEGFKPQIF